MKVFFFLCRDGDELSSLGSMSQKIVVRATDDIFDDTRKKMTLAEEESKKQWYFFKLLVHMPKRPQLYLVVRPRRWPQCPLHTVR